MPDIDPPPDIGSALVRGTLGLIPGVGSIITELVGEIVPDQRQERIRDYLFLLNQRLATVEEAELRRRIREPENVNLFEEGATQAIRALSEERKAYIADLVASGITGDAAARLRAKRLLALLREIDDDQIVILVGRLSRNLEDAAFYERHKAVLESPATDLGSGFDQETLDLATVHKQAEAHLIRLGLLRARFERPRPGEVPEFDQRTGMMKVTSTDLSELGHLLLCHIGLAEPDEF